MEVSGQLHAPAALPPGKSPHYSLDRWLGGLQNRSGRSGKKVPYPRQKSNPGRPARSLVTIRTEISRLLAKIKERQETYTKFV